MQEDDGVSGLGLKMCGIAGLQDVGGFPQE